MRLPRLRPIFLIDSVRFRARQVYQAGMRMFGRCFGGFTVLGLGEPSVSAGPSATPLDPYAGVREPRRGGSGGGRSSAIALEEPLPPRRTRAVSSRGAR